MSATSPTLPASEPRFGALALTLRIVSIFAVLTGVMDILVGTWFLTSAGSQISAAAAADPALDSQIRFLSAMWLGFGVALWWVAQDLRGRAQLLHILAGAFFLGGIGRVISLIVHGVPPALFLAFMVMEIAGPVAVLLWHRKLVRT